ncbi:hypothetical protein E4T39_08324 [Aureobasidium subglaciale]|nr:hypothetical protein E4T39_08324 [Aureobasidium subglaciale]
MSEQTMTLPESRAFATSLITFLQTKPPSPTTPTSNPLKHASPADRSVLLTLHVLFPNELLSALDLLDRELVVRLLPIPQTKNPPPAPEFNAEETDPGHETNTAAPNGIVKSIKEAGKGYTNTVYYVRSAQQTSSNSRFRDPVASTNLPEDEGGEAVEPVVEGEEQEWMVGGLSLGKDVPMCKHLLACVLSERGGMFGAYVKTREVSVGELAGWAAGWGG